MPTEGKPASGGGEKPPSGPQATSPDLEDTDHGWSESPPPVPDTTPELAKPPGFPPPPPLPPGRVAELKGATATSATTKELPIPAVPVKEVGSSPVASKPAPVAAPPPSPVAGPAANPALAVTEPHTVLPVTVPHHALAPTEPQRPAMPFAGSSSPTEASPPAFPVPPPLPAAPELPPPIPMSSVNPVAAPPLLVSPIGTRPAGAAATPSEAALSPPGLVARLRASRPSGAWLLIGSVVALLAFGGGLLTGRSLAGSKVSKATDAEPEKAEKKSASQRPATPAETKPAEPAAAPATKPAEGGGAKHPFNQKLARAAVDRAAARTKGCRAARDPAGSVSTTITFAPAGNVSNVTITTPRYAGTKTGACIVSRLSEARVPAFTGNATTLKKSIVIR